LRLQEWQGASFGKQKSEIGGSASQEDDLKALVGARLPRKTRQIGAIIEEGFGLIYESRSGLIALLHRLGLE
jgi:transposase